MLAEIEAIGTVIGAFTLVFSLPLERPIMSLVGIIIFIINVIALAIKGEKNGK